MAFWMTESHEAKATVFRTIRDVVFLYCLLPDDVTCLLPFLDCFHLTCKEVHIAFPWKIRQRARERAKGVPE